MTTISLAQDGPQMSHARFRRILILTLAASILFGGGELTAARIFSSTPLAIVGVATLCLGLFNLAALAFLHRSRPRPAAVVICAAILTFGGAVVYALPDMLTSTILSTIVTVGIAVLYLERRGLTATMVAAGFAAGVYTLLARADRPFAAPPPWVATSLMLSSTVVMIAVILYSLGAIYYRIRASLSASQAANASLEQLKTQLEHKVAERTADLHMALECLEARTQQQARMLADLEQQRLTIRELSVPVLPLSDTTLVMPLVGALEAGRLQDAQEQALAAIERTRARMLVLDITGVPVVDTHVARGLIEVVQSARLLGAETVLVGIRPEVAQSIVGLGIDLRGIRAAADLQTALFSTNSALSERVFH